MAGRRISVARCSFFLSDKEEHCRNSISATRDPLALHREEVICLGVFLGGVFLVVFRFSGMVTKPTDHCHLVLVDGEHAPPGLLARTFRPVVDSVVFRDRW